MAFSLGSLFVELKADVGHYLAGMSKASASTVKAGREIEKGLSEIGGLLSPLGEMGERLAGILGGVGSAAGGMLTGLGKSKSALMGLTAGIGGVTALAGGMFGLAVAASEQGAKIFEASEKTGIGAAQMSGLLALTKETKGNFEGLTTSLARAGANLEKAIIEPGAVSSKVLAQVMGSSKALADLGLKPMGDRLQAVLSRIFAMSDAGQRNLALNSLLGRGWSENVSTLKLLAEQGYAPAIKQARAFGLFFDDASARQAKQFQVALADMQATLSGMGLAIGERLIPVFKEFAVAMVGLRSYAPTLGKLFMAWGEVATGHVVEGLKDYAKGLKGLPGAYRESLQAQTDFLTHLDNLTAGQKSATEETGKLTGGLRQHADALAGIIEREHDELEATATAGNRQRELQAEYQRTTREIQKQVAAGGSYVEAFTAMGLAVAVYRAKLLALMQDTVKVPKGPGVPVLPGAPPALRVPAGMSNAEAYGPGAVGAPLSGMGETLAQLAQLPGQFDSTRGAEKALREETELSEASFRKLAAAFPGLTEAEVAATAAGRRMIEQLTKLDQLGTMGQQFTEFKNKLIDDGNEVASKLIGTLGGALNQIEDQLAHLVVTGKANFKQIYTGMEEQLVKTGLQKGVSSILGHIPGLNGLGGGKPDGTAGNPLHVVMARGSLPGGGGAPQAAGGLGGPPSTSTMAQVSGMMRSAEGGFSAISKLFGGLFSGFLAGGGDVMPGRSYVVGEKHPELFVPRQAGEIVPGGGAKAMRPLQYAPTFNISTPDADSFRRSHAQIVSEGYRTLAAVHARTS